MRFPHNAKIFRGQLDAAPFAGVLFLLLLFLLVQSSLVFVPGIPIELPATSDLPGPTNRTVSVAVDQDGIVYFENQIASDAQLRDRLRELASQAPDPLTVVVLADRSVPYEVLVRLTLVAREAGIHQALLATRPAVVPQPIESNP